MKLQLPESFYQEEERSGFLVSEKRKKVWAVELDLLYQIQQICEKYNIQYFAYGGTLLGAERHRGMIPWDDDVDLVMTRDQYELFLGHADEFESPYFLQCFDTEPGYFSGHAQLRNSDTTAVVRLDLESNYGKERMPTVNQGIFVDVFVLDNVVRNRTYLKKQIEHIDRYRSQAQILYRTSEGFNRQNASLQRKMFHIVSPAINRVYSYRDAWNRFEMEVQKYNPVETKYVGNLSYEPHNQRTYDLRSEFDATVYLDFEMLKLPAPAGYKLHLKRQYGDYMKFVIGTSEHGSIFFDTDTPYDEWLLDHPTLAAAEASGADKL